MEREPTRPTDDVLILGAIRRLEADDWQGLLTDAEARLIASQRHGGQNSGMYSFVSTGAISEDAKLEARIDYEIALANNYQENAFAFDALGMYFLEHGERGPVEGWHSATKWDTENQPLNITDAEARVIAAQIDDAPAIRIFAETGQIDADAMRTELTPLLKRAFIHLPDEQEAMRLAALDQYVADHESGDE